VFTCFTLLLFFLHDTAPTEIYTLSLHDALPISRGEGRPCRRRRSGAEGVPSGPPWSSSFRGVPERSRTVPPSAPREGGGSRPRRSEEHTSELQSRENLVCRLLLEKKKNKVIRCN